MKILLLSSSYAPVLGGLQTVTQELARNLLARGHDIRVVTNRYPRRLAECEIVDGVCVQRWQFLRPSWRQLRQGRLDLFLASLYYGPSTRRRLRRLLASFQPDAVNVHFPDAQIPFVLGLNRRFGFRLVVSLHGHEVERYTANAEHSSDSRGLRALLRQADAVTACSRHLLESACRLEPSVHDKGAVLYNGIDLERFHNALRYSHHRPYLFAMGRLTLKKGFDLLLQALARIEVPAQGLDVIIAGEGEELPALREQTRKLGLERRVHFHGRASQEEVVRLLNGCLFAVVPSRVEPFGIVALEALAAGRPVLATRVGGMAEFLGRFVEGENAKSQSASVRKGRQPVLLVEPGEEELAEGMRQLLGWAGTEQRGIEALDLSAWRWEAVAQRCERILLGETKPQNR